MPLDESLLGFSNKHYIEGFKHKKRISLPDGQQIYVFSLGYFLASKIEAFFGRGISDPRFSTDLEDIVAILSDARDFEMILNDRSVIPFLQNAFNKIFNDPACLEAISGFLVGPVTGQYDLILKRASFIIENKTLVVNKYSSIQTKISENLDQLD